MTQPTIQEFKTWCRDNRRLAEAVCLAQAAKEVTRQKVDAYIRPIFDSYAFKFCGPLSEKLDSRGGARTGELLPSPDDMYLCDDPRIPDYYAACDAEHRRQGYDLPEGHCPALVAAHIHVQAEWALMDSAGPLFGMTEHPHMPEDRKRYLDLLLGACLNVPGVRPATAGSMMQRLVTA